MKYNKEGLRRKLRPVIQVQITTYRDSISKSILQLFSIGGWLPLDKLEDVTEDYLKKFFSNYSFVAIEKFELDLIKKIG